MESKNLNRLLEATLWLSVATGFLYLFEVLGERYPTHFFYNSDSLFLPIYFGDVIFSEYEPTGWIAPPSLFMFPDGLLTFLIVLLPIPPLAVLYLYAIVQLLLLLFCHLLVFRPLLKTQKDFGRLRIVFLFVAGGILFLAARGAGARVFLLLFVSVYHTGAYLCALLAISLVQKYFAEQRRIYLIGLLILSGLAIFSDRLFLVQFLIPVLLTSFVFAFRGERKRSLWIMVALFLSIPLGFKITSLVTKSNLFIFLPLGLGEHIRTGLAMLFQGLPVSFLTHLYELWEIWFLPFWVLWFLYLIYRVFVFLKSIWFTSEFTPDPLNFFELFSFFLVLTNLCAVMLFGWRHNAFPVRYYIPVLVLPFFFTGFYLVTFTRVKAFRWISLLILPLSILIITSEVLLRKKTVAELINHQPVLPECVDRLASRHGLTYGLSDYWQANHVTYFSRRGVRMHQIERNMATWLRNNNYFWYRGERDSGRVPYPNFIIMDGLDKDLIVSKVGRPTRLERCANSEIYIYEERDAADLRKYYDELLEKLRVWEGLVGRR